MRKTFLTGILTILLLFVSLLSLDLLAAPTQPAGEHCGDVGPLPINASDFCGCTWGKVRFQGQVVPGAVITLTFNNQSITQTTQLTSLEAEPYFDLTAHNLGAKRGDVLTLTAQFAGKTVKRTFRALPQSNGEQRIDLTFTKQGRWAPLITGGYTQTLAISQSTVWAGGAAGVIEIDLNTGITQSHTLPWAEQSIRALAIGQNGHVWVAGNSGVAELYNATWHTHTLPISGTPRALTVDPANGTIWLGSGDGATGALARYTGSWQKVKTFNAPVTTLAVDSVGRLWAGVWGKGIFRQDGSGSWLQYRVADGLPSDSVLSLAAGQNAVWVGTVPYLSGQGPRGGVGRYNLNSDSWQVYTTSHGLPADHYLPQSPAPVYALTLQNDIPWLGTTDGLRFLAGKDYWAAYTTTHGLRPAPVKALAGNNSTLVAATTLGIDRFLPDESLSYVPPTAQINTITPLSPTTDVTITLSGNGTGSESHIVAWDWSSNQDGPLCTQANCTLPGNLLSRGNHTISFQVQDERGYWSAPATASLFVTAKQYIYLPLVIRR